MTTIIIKNSSTSSAVPVSGDLTKGELAVNVTDKKLYTKDNGGSVVKLVGGLGNQEASAVAITGGAIDGTPIGATTASTASFTTLSASGNVTLSGGTANGVLYLNGSKVATSGSALTFDGTGFQLSTSTGGNFYLNSTTTGTSNQIVSLLNNGNGYSNLNYKAFDHIWSYGATEGMRLTSTGLGIGTSSPGAKLDVTGTFNGTQAVFGNTSGRGLLIGTALNGGVNEGSSVLNARGAGNGQFLFQTDGTTRMTLNDSGNLGLGVTPTSQQASYRAIDISSSNSANYWALAGHGSAACEGNLLWNAYTTGNETFAYKYTGDAAARFRQSSYFAWFTAASGTAGNAITFTQAMTLDASGNLLVGTTTAAGIVSVEQRGNTGVGSICSAYNHFHAGTKYADFLWYGSSIGSITNVSGTAVAYNTTSDYRLKNIDGPLTGSGAFIDALKPKVGTWKANGSKFVGFLAHEVQEVSPGSVVGEKDGEQMQAMEYGSAEFIANIIAELQSLRARVAALES